MLCNEHCTESETQNSYRCIYRLLALVTVWLPGSCGVATSAQHRKRVCTASH